MCDVAPDMDDKITISTHVGPLMTQIRDTDTVQSFMNELKDSVIRHSGASGSFSWHYLTYRSRILKGSDRLLDVVKNRNEGLVYIHPWPISGSSPAKPSVSASSGLHSSSSAPAQSPSSTLIPISQSQSAAPKRRSSVSITAPSDLPPRSFFNAANMESLEGMGFAEIKVKQALLIHEEDFALALDWLLALEDPRAEAPLSKPDQDAVKEAVTRYRALHPRN